MATLTIFANFRIDDEERFMRMQDSFYSFKDISAAKWVINARGKFKHETMTFLKEHLAEKLISYDLESNKGWLYDSAQMLKDINTDFVLLWVEDHINLVDTQKYDHILTDLKESGSEYMEYSWWHFGKPLAVHAATPKKEFETLFALTLDKPTLSEIEKNHSIFIISMIGIFSKDLFEKIITKTPLFLRQYPKETPFNFEKGGAEKSWLPIKVAIPKEELFASIDADTPEGGYSLQSRGLYPARVARAAATPHQPSQIGKCVQVLMPTSLYKQLIHVIIFSNRVRKYLALVLKGH